MKDIKIIEIEPEYCLSIRRTIPFAKIGEEMGKAYHELIMFIQSKGVRMTGPPFALYYSYERGVVDVDCGISTDGKQDGEGDIRPITLPGGKVVTALHVGSYDRLVEAYTAMGEWMKGEGLRPKMVMWEKYLTDPQVEKDPDQWMTQIFWPFE